MLHDITGGKDYIVFKRKRKMNSVYHMFRDWSLKGYNMHHRGHKSQHFSN